MISRIQWQSPGLYWISALALIAVLAAVLMFYRPQVQPLARRVAWAWFLPWMRTLALGILAMALLRPAILKPVRDDDPGIVAVLIDRSKSMNAVDAGRRPEQLVRLAAGLGMLDPSVRPEDLEQLRARVADLSRLADEMDRAAAELKYARLANRGMEAATAHMRDARNALEVAVKAAAASSQLPLHEEIKKIGGDFASQQITETLNKIDVMQVEADEELYQTDASVRAVCDKLEAKSRIELVSESLATGAFERIEAERPVRIFVDSSLPLRPEELKAKPLSAGEFHTDLVGQLRELHRRLTGQHVAAVVLFSDGKENSPTSPVNGLVDWPEVPIVAVDVGSPQPKDIAIEKISVPLSAAAGETVHVRGSVHQFGFDGREIEVVFSAEQKKQARRVSLSGESTPIEFTFTAERAGPCEVTLSAPPQRGEATAANNQIRRMMKMTSDRLRVAVIAGSSPRDIQQLRDALKDAPGMMLLDGPIESGKCPLSQADLGSADVVVLRDVPVNALDAQQWDAINQAITHRGGSVILCAGDDPTILASYARQPLIAAMLPWRGAAPAWRASPGDQPAFRVAPVDAQAFETIKLSDDASTNRQRWNQRPPVTRIMSLPPLKPDVRKILNDRDSASPVLTQMQSGAGRAFFVGIDELWRWRDVAGEEPVEKDRFWLEFIRRAGHPPYAISDADLGLDVDRLLLEPGETLAVRARFSTTGARLRIEKSGSLVQEESLLSSDASNGRFEKDFDDLDVGSYTLRLIANDREISLPVLVAASGEDEMRDVSGDAAELQRIVGGRGAVLGLDELPSLPQRLMELRRTEARFNEMRLWDSPYLFMFVVGCLGLEWAVRKHVGLT